MIFIGENYLVLVEMVEEFYGWVGMGLYLVLGLLVWLVFVGVVVVWFLYLKCLELLVLICCVFGLIYMLLDNKYYMDKINEVVFVCGLVVIGCGLWKEGDVVVIDGFVNGSVWFIGWFVGVICFF